MNAKGNQKGVALIVTLVLLVVALLLGISSFQSSRMDEGMAGNYRASSAAFMAAEYGGSELWEDFLVERATLCDATFNNFSDITLADADTQLKLQYRYTCSPEFDEDTMVEKFGRYSLVSTGKVVQEVPVHRHILYAARLGIGPGAPLVAANEPDDCDGTTITLPSSNTDFVGDEDVDGNFKAALQVGCDALALESAESVLKNSQEPVLDDTGTYSCDPSDSGNNNLCNYKGGIQGSIDIEILKNPALLAEFLRTLRYDDPSNPSDPTSPAGVNVINSFPASAEGVTFLEPTSAQPRDALGRATFVEGGNFSGNGILVVDGNVNFKGVPSFEGLIIVLGDYLVDGGGGAQQGTFRGSVVAAPLDWTHDGVDVDGNSFNYTLANGNEYESCPENTSCGHAFAPKTLEIGGGGSSPYIFDDVALLEAFGLIDDITLEDGRNITDLWGINGVSLGDRYYISEWQEIFNIDDAGMGGGS